MGELPDNIKRIDVLRIEYGKRKLCECNDFQYKIDYQNKLIYCTKCGAIIDPFTAICNLASHWDRVCDQVDNLLKQRKEIVDYKPWLLTFRNLESQYRSGKMLPCCPNCIKPFYFEKISSWTDRQFYEKRKGQEQKEVDK